MANSSKILVEIPTEKGVHVKSAGAKGEKYVYQYTKFFRNADGNPRNKSKSIGKVEAERRQDGSQFKLLRYVQRHS